MQDDWNEGEPTALDCLRVALARHRLNGTQASIEMLMGETGLTYGMVVDDFEAIRAVSAADKLVRRTK